MGVELETIVPWGRSFDEYVRMFDLAESDLQRRILGCGDGPAAFNASLTKRGGRIVSVDPIYALDEVLIRKRIAETYDTVLAQVLKNRSDYVWDSISSPEQLGSLRMSAMETFLDDFAPGREQGRYIPGELPSLPFADGAFDLALSSHFLFLYSAGLSAGFHFEALHEMLRVAGEVRVFPLLTLAGSRSPHLPYVTERLGQRGYCIETRRVPYEFQRGGNEMLVILPA
jgi:hypothetical protein